MDDLLQEFLAETVGGIAAFDRDLNRLRLDPADPEPLDRLSRFVHTIRGTCGFLDLPRLAALARAVEDSLADFQGVKATPETMAPILDALDRIGAILAALQATGHEPAGSDADLIGGLQANDPDGVAAQRPSQDIVVAPAPAVAEQSKPALPDHIPASTPLARPSDLAVRLELDLLETLRHKADDLILSRNHLLQMLRDRPERRIAEPLRLLGEIVEELQADIARARLQPAASAWAGLHGLVAELAAASGKQMNLQATGGEILLDCQLVAWIREPLVHLVRNAAEHGIEAPARRLAAGKPETGTINLDARREGETVILTVGDDGCGLAPGRLKAVALTRGLANVAEIETLPSAAARDLLFRPESPTLGETDRPHGFDIVRQALAKLGGTIELSTGEAEGTSFVMRFPANVTAMPAVILESAGERYALPQLNLVEILSADGQNIDRSEGESLLHLGDRSLPLMTLREILAQDAGASGEDTIVVLRTGSYRFGLVVDAIVGREEVLVSMLPPSLGGIAAFAGSTILADGRAALVLDPGAVAAGVAKQPRVGAKAGQPTGRGELPLLLFRTRDDLALKGVPLSRLARIERMDASTDGPSPSQMDGRFALILVNGAGMAPLAVEEVVDLVEGRVSVDIADSRPGILGRAVVAGRAVEIIDVAYHVNAAHKAERTLSAGSQQP